MEEDGAAALPLALVVVSTYSQSRLLTSLLAGSGSRLAPCSPPGVTGAAYAKLCVKLLTPAEGVEGAEFALECEIGVAGVAGRDGRRPEKLLLNITTTEVDLGAGGTKLEGAEDEVEAATVDAAAAAVEMAAVAADFSCSATSCCRSFMDEREGSAPS